MSERRDPGAIVAGLRALLDALDDGRPVDARNVAASLRAAVDLLDAAPRWVRKTDAARLCGVTVETIRGRCRRKTDPLPTTWRDGRELVDVTALRDELARRPQTTASRAPDAHSS